MYPIDTRIDGLKIRALYSCFSSKQFSLSLVRALNLIRNRLHVTPLNILGLMFNKHQENPNVVYIAVFVKNNETPELYSNFVDNLSGKGVTFSLVYQDCNSFEFSITSTETDKQLKNVSQLLRGIYLQPMQNQVELEILNLIGSKYSKINPYKLFEIASRNDVYTLKHECKTYKLSIEAGEIIATEMCCKYLPFGDFPERIKNSFKNDKKLVVKVNNMKFNIISIGEIVGNSKLYLVPA